MTPTQPPRTTLAPATQAKDYWLIVLKHGQWVILVLAVALALTWFLTERQTKTYRSAAVIEMVPPRLSSVGGATFAPRIFQDVSYLKTQLVKLEMRSTLNDAITDAELVGHEDLVGMAKADILAAAGSVRASQRRGQYLVDVSISGSNHKVLDDLCNALVRHFRAIQRDESELQRKSRKSELEERVASTSSGMSVREVQKRSALEQQGFSEASFDDEYLKLSNDRRRFLDKRTEVQIQKIEDEATYRAFAAALQDGAEGPESLSQHPRVLANEDVRDALNRIATLRAEQAELRARKAGRKDPEILSLDRAIARVEARRREVQDAYVRHFVSGYEALDPQLIAYETLAAEKDRDLKQAAGVRARLDEINADTARLAGEKAAAQRELELLAPSAFGVVDSVKVISWAGEPSASRPVSPNKPMNFALGAVLGLLGGVGLAFLAEHLDDTILSKVDLERISDAPLIGVIPRISAHKKDVGKRDLMAYREKKSSVAEAFRGIRTALTLRDRAGRRSVLLFSSAGPREGKTTTATNMACVLAQSGDSVVLVDADLRKPRIHKSMELENVNGLSSLLTQDADPSEFTQTMPDVGIDVITSGPIPPNPAELLGSRKMRNLIAELKSRYDHVILDTPPIGAVTDAAVLGTMVDGVILVVHAGKTRRGVVTRCIEQLNFIEAPIEGIILNNLSTRALKYYAGYHSYYYYYSYYGSGRTPKLTDAESRPDKPEPEKPGPDDQRSPDDERGAAA